MSTKQVTEEFELTEMQFDHLRDLVREHTGISLSDAKRELVYGRLARRLRALKLTSFAEYCTLIESKPAEEMQELTNAITTNLTSFFRENYHFDQLKSEVLPYIQRVRGNVRRIRIWSAGCSTGEEPYSLAMIMQEALNNLAGWDIKILATDIDSKVVSIAAEGVYASERLKGVNIERIKRWFPPIEGKPGFRRVSDDLKLLITFKQLNLFDPWPMKGLFDVIFCRNVVIYFDKNTQRALFERMAQLQEPDSWLFIGHSENLFNVTNRYKPVGRTAYRRVG